MKKVTVQLKKLLLEEGINRRKENSYQAPVITPFLPTGFSRVSVRKTGQPEPNQHDLTTLRRIQYSQEEGPGHISRGSTKFD
jgi:hypothetical protein